jgi:hypothetical protein
VARSGRDRHPAGPAARRDGRDGHRPRRREDDLAPAPLYEAIVIDTPTTLSEVTLAFLDACDVVLSIVTYDSTTIHNTIAVAEVFASIGYRPTRSTTWSTGPTRAAASAATSWPERSAAAGLRGRLGRPPRRPGEQRGMPFVVSSPDAAVSRDVRRVAATICMGARPALRETLRPCPTRVPSAFSTPESAA